MCVCCARAGWGLGGGVPNTDFTMLGHCREKELCTCSFFGLFSVQTFCLREAVTYPRIHEFTEFTILKLYVYVQRHYAPGVSAQIQSVFLRQELRRRGPRATAARGPITSPQSADACQLEALGCPPRSSRGRDRTRAHGAARGSARRRRSTGRPAG